MGSETKFSPALFFLVMGSSENSSLTPFFPTSLPGGNGEMEPPDTIPNSEVKRLSADDSVGSPHVKVGHRQALIQNPRYICIGGFSFVAINSRAVAALAHPGAPRHKTIPGQNLLVLRVGTTVQNPESSGRVFLQRLCQRRNIVGVSSWGRVCKVLSAKLTPIPS